jgi:hypothetical protein
VTHKQKSFPLRIAEAERARAQQLARSMGLSENRLYSDLIQEGLLMREQMEYMSHLRSMRVSGDRGLELLGLVPDVPALPGDRIPGNRRGRRVS